MYEGRKGKVCVTDPDTLRAIMVKDFSHFVNRNPVEMGNEITNQMLDFLNGLSLFLKLLEIFKIQAQ